MPILNSWLGSVLGLACLPACDCFGLAGSTASETAVYPQCAEDIAALWLPSTAFVPDDAFIDALQLALTSAQSQLGSVGFRLLCTDRGDGMQSVAL